MRLAGWRSFGGRCTTVVYPPAVRWDCERFLLLRALLLLAVYAASWYDFKHRTFYSRFLVNAVVGSAAGDKWTCFAYSLRGFISFTFTAELYVHALPSLLSFSSSHVSHRLFFCSLSLFPSVLLAVVYGSVAGLERICCLHIPVGLPLTWHPLPLLPMAKHGGGDVGFTII